jgi:hypothetical protein
VKGGGGEEEDSFEFQIVSLDNKVNSTLRKKNKIRKTSNLLNKIFKICIIYTVKNRDAPDIRPHNPAFFYIRYPAGYRYRYQIAQPDIR